MACVAAETALMDVIQEEIRAENAITFTRYMELALYHPQFGYYRTQNPFGKQGDFYTAEQLQPVFGEIVATYVENLANTEGAPDDFQVLELGAGRAEMQSALSRWRYQAVDWYAPALPQSWTGLVFANEFFDALPVHLLRKTAEGWQEIYVTGDEQQLRFISVPLRHPDLIAYAALFGESIPEGGKLEACLSVKNWLLAVRNFLRTGRVLVIDYGYQARELVRFPEGSLLSYTRHRASVNVLANPGERDITAHVNFTWLEQCAQAAGFELEFASTLQTWMLEIWAEQELQSRWNAADPQWRLQWKQLVFGLGETFRVMQFRVKEESARMT